jgi:hypothetical protein
MIGPLRRSLGERLLTSTSTVCAGCRRHIHIQNTLHGAAAAQVQRSAEGSILKMIRETPLKNDNPKQTQPKNPNASAQQVINPAQVKEPNLAAKSSVSESPSSIDSTNSNKSESTKTVKAEPKILLPTGSPLNTAHDMGSHHMWYKPDILNLYKPPTEDEIPSSLEVIQPRSGKKKTGPEFVTKTYKWRDEPFLFIEEALRLAPKIHNVQLGKPTIRQRARLTVSWGPITHTVIGDGPTKVQLPALNVY